jgi:hypothetical protein
MAGKRLITDGCNDPKQELGRSGQILAAPAGESFTIPRLMQPPVDKAAVGVLRSGAYLISCKRG